MAGFANEGPTDEVVGVGNITEFEQIYGQPRTPAERYFYHSARAALNSTGKLMVNRLPYGPDAGQGFGSKISVLAYPASGYDRMDTNLEIRNVAGNITTSENCDTVNKHLQILSRGRTDGKHLIFGQPATSPKI